MAHELSPRRDDDRGSIVMAMLLIMIGTMAATLLLPVLIAQVDTSQFDVRRQHSLDAAQSGIEAATGQIRDANDGAGIGKRGSLPCTSSSTPLTGEAGGNERYQAWIYYFARDPHGNDAWLSDPSKQIACLPGNGTAVTPLYAVVVAKGSDNADGSFGSGVRTLQATYTLKSKNANSPGGAISEGTARQLCFDAMSTSPAAGAAVFLQPCAPDSGSQTWAFTDNWSLRLVASGDPSQGDLGMCITTVYPHSTGQAVQLQPCTATTTPSQEWAFSTNNDITNMNSLGKNDRVWCLTGSGTTAGSVVGMGSCRSSPTGVPLCMVPDCWDQDPSVGSGGATGAPYLFNYGLFGSCMVGQYYGTVDRAQPGWKDFLPMAQCPASPDPDGQWTVGEFKYTPPVAGTTGTKTTFVSFATYQSYGNYCIISPLAVGGQVFVDRCSLYSTAAKTWTIYGDTGTYATSYRIMDANGNCLAPKTTQSGINGNVGVVTNCSATTLQKWNAPPGIFTSPVGDYHEVSR